MWQVGPSFLLDTGAAYPVLVSFSGPFSSDSCQVTGVSGKLTTRPFAVPLYCYWEGYTFCHSFLVIPECSLPLLGRDIMNKQGAKLVLEEITPVTPL